MEIQTSYLIQKAWVSFLVSDFDLFFIDPLIRTHIHMSYSRIFIPSSFSLGLLHKCKHDSRTLSPLAANILIRLTLPFLYSVDLRGFLFNQKTVCEMYFSNLFWSPVTQISVMMVPAIDL